MSKIWPWALASIAPFVVQSQHNSKPTALSSSMIVVGCKLTERWTLETGTLELQAHLGPDVHK